MLRTCFGPICGVIQHVSKIILVTIRGGNPDFPPYPTDQQILPLTLSSEVIEKKMTELESTFAHVKMYI